MNWNWLKKKLNDLINYIDDPFDNLKHYLFGYHKIFGKCVLIKVPMKNKNYYGFEIRIVEKGVCDEKIKV